MNVFQEKLVTDVRPVGFIASFLSGDQKSFKLSYVRRFEKNTASAFKSHAKDIT